MNGWTAKDTPDQRGRVVAITGANSGIGYESAIALMRKGAQVVMACRSLEKAKRAREDFLSVVPKADVNAAQVDGATALHWAVFRDNVEAARLLIKAGAKVDVSTREGISPLNMASLYGNTTMIRMLLEAGADAKQKGPLGETMVMLAARMLWSKGVKEFVQAVRLMRDAGVSARFALVGGPDTGNPAAIPVTQLKAWARERGATHLELDSAETRTDAHRFYERENPSWRSICFAWEL